MRPSGLEPPRGKLPTRPSTLRVYQFRHGRRGASIAPGALGRCPRPRAIGLATARRARARALGSNDRPPLHPSTGGASLRTHVRSRPQRTNSEPEQGAKRHGSDQAPARDLRLHPQVLGQVRLPADGARHRQGRGPRVLIDGARPPGQPREDRPAQARSIEAARDRAARPRRWWAPRWTACAGSSAPTACRCWARSPRARRCSPRRTSRTTCRCRRWRAAGTASTCCRSAANR